MKLSEIKDANGTSLQAYAETIMGKARDADLITVLVFVSKAGDEKGIHVLTSADGSPARLLLAVGKAMLAEPDEREVIGAVSPEQVN